MQEMQGGPRATTRTECQGARGQMELEESATLQLGIKGEGHFCGQQDERSRREKQSEKVDWSQRVEDVIREVLKSVRWGGGELTEQRCLEEWEGSVLL